MTVVAVLLWAVLSVFYTRLRRSDTKRAAREQPVEQQRDPSKGDEVVVRHVVSFQPGFVVPAAARAEQGPAQASEKSPAEYREELEGAFQTDAPADRPATEMSSSLVAALRAPGAQGMTVDRAECHKTRCRLDVRLDDDTADRRVFADFFNLLKAQGMDTRGLTFVVPVRESGPDGRIHAVVHVFRQEASPG